MSRHAASIRSQRHDQRAQQRANDGKCTDDLPGFVFVAHGEAVNPSVMKLKVGPPLAGIGAPLSTAFQLPCPNPTAAYSRTDRTSHISRTAAVICITKLDQAANSLTRSIAGACNSSPFAQGHKLNCK
jgi:hypothetical protein